MREYALMRHLNVHFNMHNLALCICTHWDLSKFQPMPFRGFPDSSEIKNPPTNAGDTGLIPGSGRSPGEGNGNPLQCSCLENPRDWGASWAAVYGVAQSWTWLKWLSSSSSNMTSRCLCFKTMPVWIRATSSNWHVAISSFVLFFFSCITQITS